MNIKTINFSQLKKTVLGTVAAIGICTLGFSGMSQVVEASAVNQTKTIPTKYSTAVNQAQPNQVPAGYVKAAYQTKLSEFSGQPGIQDLSMEKAAEIGAQNLWKFFGVDLTGKTIDMSYYTPTDSSPRAQWEGIIFINKVPSYSFSVDAITGEYRTVGQEKYWTGNINTGMDKELIENHGQYAALAKKVAEKFQVVSGQIVSVQYAGQGMSSFKDVGVNSDISMIVKSDNGQQAQLKFSRYNQELLDVAYDPWVKEARAYEQQIEKEMQERAAKSVKPSQQGVELKLVPSN
ncbi:MAG: hypothetical protein ABFD18_20920 [Syntrophomonas sp.]